MTDTEKTQPLTPVQKYIARLGGCAAIARLCGLQRCAVWQWGARNKIPRGWRKFLATTFPTLEVPGATGPKKTTGRPRQKVDESLMRVNA